MARYAILNNLRRRIQKTIEYCERNNLTRSLVLHASYMWLELLDLSWAMLPLLIMRSNLYDEEETEYWIDSRTSGKRGQQQRSGTEDRRESAVVTSASSAMPVNINEPVTDDFLANQHPPGLQVEGGNKVKGSGFADNVASFHRARARTIKHASC